MYTCKYCGATFETKGQIGHHVSFEHGSLSDTLLLMKRVAEEDYYEDPRRCLNCREIIPYSKGVYTKKFCNSSCAASYNNTHRPKKIPRKRILASDRSDLLWAPLLDKWKNGEDLEEFSCQGQVSFGDLKNSIKRKIKEILLEEQQHKCAICGQEDIWEGKPFIMILDHIDGDPRNHIKENLRLICPICDVQLPTHGSKNRGHGRHSGRMSKQRQKEKLIKVDT